MRPSDKRKLGRTSVETTILGFGGSTIGNIDRHRVISEDDAVSAIAGGWEAGIRYFDTAPFYGAGLGEHRLGHALRRHPRESYVLSTKVGVLLNPHAPQTEDCGRYAHRLPFDVVYDYGYDATMRSIEDSMQRLGLHRFDVALIHDIDIYTHGVDSQKERFREAMAGAYPALEELKRAGVIRAIGVGVTSWEVCEECARAADFDCFILAGRYTLLEQSPLKSFFPLCESRNITVIAAAPFNSGILVYGAVDGAHYNYKPAPPEVLKRTHRIELVCQRHGVHLAAAAVQFPLAHAVVASVLPGPRNSAQVGKSVAWLEESIPASFWQELKAEGLIDTRSPIP